MAVEVFGPAFVDYPLLRDGHAPNVCGGCAAFLGGAASKENPPLRSSHFAVVGQTLLRPSGEELVELLVEPPDDLRAIAYTAGRKRHASLRCGPCSPDHLWVGTEERALEWVPSRDRALVFAVREMRRVVRADDIAVGAYAPHVIQALGLDRWRDLETVIAPYRPSATLDMICAIVRKPTDDLQLEPAPMPIHAGYRRTARILHLLCKSSDRRFSDPITFWAEYLPRRLGAAASSASLTEWLAYLIDQLQVRPGAPTTVEALRTIEAMTDEEHLESLGLLRRDHRVLVTYARMIGEEEKEASA